MSKQTIINPRNDLIAETEGFSRKYVAAEVAFYSREIEAIRAIKADDGSIAKGLARAQAVIKAETARDAATTFGDCLVWNAAVMVEAGLSGISSDILSITASRVKTGRARIVIAETKAGRKVPTVKCAYQPHESTSPRRDREAI